MISDFVKSAGYAASAVKGSFPTFALLLVMTALLLRPLVSIGVGNIALIGIYFCARIKKDKIDASGSGGNNNVATILNQARMAVDHPLFEADTNRKVLLDHLYLISPGDYPRREHMACGTPR